jgi:hypothetical protein
MINKTNAIEYFLQSFTLLATSSTAIVFFAGFNPWHGIIGAVGQLLYLIMEYLRAFKSGKDIKQKTLLYWISVLIIGASLGYLGTGWVSEKIGINELISGIGLGFFAQTLPELYDLAVSLFFGFLKKKYGNE